VLEALACVESRPREEFAMLNDCIDERAGELSSCVCVLLAWDEERRELVARLRRTGVPVLVLLMDETLDEVSPEPGPMADQPDRFRVLSPGRLAPALAELSP
jgi:rRNA-processing protein FCF1